MSRYNLIDEKWIPVRFPDGRHDELGIRDTLLSSAEIAAIEDPSPLVVASLHRFLLAILYRALEGPTDINQAKILFKNGLPDEKITAYLNKWRDRFWLFDEKFPFFQIPGYNPQKKHGKMQWRPWTALTAEHNADNAKVLFDHIFIREAGSVPSNRASRWLIACQAFALGGGNSDFQYTKSSPSATAVMVLPLGVNLKDTLLLSLVPQNREVQKADLPIWERPPESLISLKQGIERAIMGWADGYTWRTRSIRFELQGDGEAVSRLAFASGIGCSSQNHIDPMLCYRISDKNSRLPLQFSDRGIWRDFDSLLPDSSNLAPLVIEHATALTRTLPERFPRAIITLGQAANKAKIEFWRMERFALPLALVEDRFIRTEIHQLLDDADDAQKFLWKSCASFARDMLSKGDRKPSKTDMSKFIQQMSVVFWYWSRLESRFHDILDKYGLDCDPDAIRCQWLKSIRETIWTAWEQHRASVATTSDAWGIRALVRAEGTLKTKMKELQDEIQKLEPQKEGV